MIRTLRTDSTHEDFKSLVRALDADLAIRDGDQTNFYSQFNKIDTIKNAIVIYEDDKPAACGAIKGYEDQCMEVKRMYTIPEYRGRGLASAVISELEKWAIELGNTRLVLETGMNQPEAISLYKKLGYKIIPNYGQYIGIQNSVCFEKPIA